jgi:hypothetical protein
MTNSASDFDSTTATDPDTAPPNDAATDSPEFSPESDSNSSTYFTSFIDFITPDLTLPQSIIVTLVLGSIALIVLGLLVFHVFYPRYKRWMIRNRLLDDIEIEYEDLRSSRRDAVHHFYWAKDRGEKKVRGDYYYWAKDRGEKKVREEFSFAIVGRRG